LIAKLESHALTAIFRERVHFDFASTAVDQRITSELTRSSNQFRLIDQAQSCCQRGLPHGLPN